MRKDYNLQTLFSYVNNVSDEFVKVQVKTLCTKLEIETDLQTIEKLSKKLADVFEKRIQTLLANHAEALDPEYYDSSCINLLELSIMSTLCILTHITKKYKILNVKDFLPDIVHQIS